MQQETKLNFSGQPVKRAQTQPGPNTPVGKGSIALAGLTMATARLLGRTTADTGAVEELTSAAAKALLAIVVADVSGLGSMATKNTGASGSFTTVDGKTVTVVDGIITTIV